MQREIKFRAWDGIRFTTSGIMFNCSTGHLETPEGARMKLYEFTGLHDRNGVEIYEGDIIGIHRVNGGVCRVGYCVFEKGKYVNKYKGTSFTDELGIYGDLQKIEVIGNIHQNPELLNATT